MVANVAADQLANGIYTRSQAAYLARLRPQTLSRWFDDEVARGPAVRRFFPEGDGGTINFVDLIQLMAVRAIRVTRAISLQKIRETASRAADVGFEFPFARENTQVFLWGDTVVLKLPDGAMMEATGKHAKHYVMEPVVLPYLEGVRFHEGMASEYRPAVAEGVLLSPHRQWGAPVIERSGYTVATLVSAVRSEGSIEAAARMCGVPETDVRVAVRFEDFLRGAA